MSAKRHPAPHNTEAKPVKSILFLLVLTFAAAPALAGHADDESHAALRPVRSYSFPEERMTDP